MARPAVSVLIRTTGRQGALMSALQSLRAQHFSDFEVVVVEDGAATLAPFLAGYTDLSIRYEALGAKGGRCIAGNQALALAQGEYCLFLDDDDEIMPEHLQGLVEQARTGNHKIVYSWSRELRVQRAQDGSILRTGRLKRWRRERFSLLQLIAGNFVPINAVLFHRSLYEMAGGFDTDLECLEDWMLWLRYAALEPQWHCVPQATAVYYVPLSGASRRRELRAWQGAVQERMRTLQFPAHLLRDDMLRHYGFALFTRKLYYYLTSFIATL